MKKSVLVIFSFIIMISILLSGCGDNEGMAGSVFDDAPEGSVAAVEIGEETNFYQSFDEAFNTVNSNTESEVVVTLLDDVSVNSQIAPSQRSGSLTIDLGGFTIDRGLSESTSNGSVFSFTASGNFTVKNGTITGGSTTSAGGGIYAGSNDINLTLEDLTVSENHSGQKGGGIFIDKNKMTVNLNSVNVKDNTSDDYGGGIFISQFRESFDMLSVSFNGSSVVDENEGKDGRNNLTIGTKFENSSFISSSEVSFNGLKSGANIKLAFDEFYQYSLGVIDEEPFNYLHPDSSDYMLERFDDWLYITTKHEHNYVGETEENFPGAITGNCSVEGCPCTFGIRIIADEFTVIDGNPKPVKIISNIPKINVEDYIKYTKKGDSTALDGAPSEVGEYTASITFAGVTTGVNFRIYPQQEPHIHDEIEYLPLTSEYAISNASSSFFNLPNGYYYLMDDLENTGIFLTEDNVTLCLNGHLLYGSGEGEYSSLYIIVNDNQSLNICNCDLETVHCFNVSGDPDHTTWTLTDDTSGAVDISTLGEEPKVGDKIFFKGAGILNNHLPLANNSKLSLSNIKFVHNFAPIGSSDDENENPAELNIDSCQFMFNHSGAIDSRGKLNVSNSEFTDNAQADMGGAIAAYDDTVIDNCNFYNNNSSFMGGALFLSGPAKISNCEFAYNYCNTFGGAIYCIGKCDIASTTIKDNISNSEGGGLFLIADANITGCTIEDNIAQYGGGVTIKENSTVKMENTKIKNNKAFIGAGVYNSGALTVENCEIVNNRMYTKEEVNTVYPNVKYEDLKFGDYYGGEGIYWNCGSLTLSGKVIIDNNKLNSSAPNDNLFIDNDKLPNALIKIGSSGLTSGSKIGISLYNYPSPGSKTKLSDNGDYYACFVSDASGYKIGEISNGLYLAKENYVMESDANNIYDLKIKNYKTGKVETVKINHGGILWVDPSVGEWEGSSEPQDITVYKSMTISDPVYEGCYFKGWKISVIDKDLVSIEAQWQY